MEDSVAKEPAELAQEQGFSKTVYSLVYPHTREVLDDFLKERSVIHRLYDRAWTKRQDPMHKPLFDGWVKYAGSGIDFDRDQFPHEYPTAGSSEAIRAVIAELASKGGQHSIHIFEGEYEGYSAFAQAHGLPVKLHKRDDWMKLDESDYVDGDVFFISEPSSIDGNGWEYFPDFVRHIETTGIRLAVDLCYVGCSYASMHIPITSQSIDYVFFSLSKSFGVYYHRIGGVFSRNPIPSLYGNMWFKNLLEIEYGVRLLKSVETAWDLPRKATDIQLEAIRLIEFRTGLILQPSDVVLLAHHSLPKNPSEMDKFLVRGNTVRYCLTPTMDQILNPQGE